MLLTDPSIHPFTNNCSNGCFRTLFALYFGRTGDWLNTPGPPICHHHCTIHHDRWKACGGETSYLSLASPHTSLSIPYFMSTNSNHNWIEKDHLRVLALKMIFCLVQERSGNWRYIQYKKLIDIGGRCNLRYWNVDQSMDGVCGGDGGDGGKGNNKLLNNCSGLTRCFPPDNELLLLLLLLLRWLRHCV